MANHLVRRGSTYFVRLTIPRERWADVGRALGATGGLKREVVRTLQTGDYREAVARRDAGLAAVRELVDLALKRAKLRPLTDWTADWQGRAIELAAAAREAEGVVNGWVQGPGENDLIPIMEAEFIDDAIERDAEIVEARQGTPAAQAFLKIATTQGLSVAAASRQWLASIEGGIKDGTGRGYQASIALLGDYLATNHRMPSLEAVSFSDVTRPIAGEVVAWRRSERTSQTTQRDYSAWNGLWRWAVRRGYTTENPWTDQMTGVKKPRAGEEMDEKRAYTPAELVALLRADGEQLAPNRGGYGPALWDTLRLGLLTGCRVSELIGLRMVDVIEDGTVIAMRKQGKSDAASRLVPLHRFAQEVIRARIASLEDKSPEASLWPEVAGADKKEKRGKTLSTRFVPVRRRILGDDDCADLHSLRRSYMTAAETAIHAGGRINSDLLALIVGHKRGAMSLDLYSEWSRMGRRIVGGMASRLATLQAAVDDTVDQGLAPEVLKALEETRDARPAVVRVATAFSRNPIKPQPAPPRVAPKRAPKAKPSSVRL